MELTQEVPPHWSLKDQGRCGHEHTHSPWAEEAVCIYQGRHSTPKLKPHRNQQSATDWAFPLPYVMQSLSFHLNTSHSQKCCMPQDTLNLGSHPLLVTLHGDPKVRPAHGSLRGPLKGAIGGGHTHSERELRAVRRAGVQD